MLDFDEETISNLLNNRICRICLAKSDNFNSIFEGSLITMIKSCLNFEVKENDGLPANICRHCIQTVSRYYTFQQKSQEVEKMLRINLEKLVIYNLEPVQSIPQEVPATLDYVSQECFSLDAIVDELNLQGDGEHFVDELAEIELQEPFAGGIEPPVVEDAPNPECQEQSSVLAVVKEPDLKVEVLSCPICGKSFGNSTTKLNRHVKEHTKAKTFICDLCDTGFSEKRFLVKHMVTHDKTREKTHICRICEKSFYDERALSLHSFRHFVSKSVQCTHCDAKFSDKASMKKHIDNIHYGEKNFKCDLCPRRFQFPSRLKEHQRAHQDEKKYECSVCHATFNQNVLAIHMKVHSGKTHECTFCGKKFTFLNNLKVHEKTHTGEKPFMCDQCGKSFVTSVKLANHKQVHSEDRVKTEKCDICDKSFSTKSVLAKHKRRHLDTQTVFTCDICAKTFTSQGSLQGHRKRHDPNKAFKCSTCDKTFKELGTLKSHERVHSGAKPYQCPHCLKGFSQSSSRNVHVKSMHSGVKIEK